MIYILDACAMIAFLRGEAGAEVVAEILRDPGDQCFAHAINLCEVYYDFCACQQRRSRERCRERSSARSDSSGEPKKKKKNKKKVRFGILRTRGGQSARTTAHWRSLR